MDNSIDVCVCVCACADEAGSVRPSYRLTRAVRQFMVTRYLQVIFFIPAARHLLGALMFDCVVKIKIIVIMIIM